MAGIAQGAGMIPPLQLSFGSSAASDAKGGSAVGGGMGALNEGNWVIQTTGTGNNDSTATSTPATAAAAAASGNPMMLVLLGVGAWLLMRKK